MESPKLVSRPVRQAGATGPAGRQAGVPLCRCHALPNPTGAFNATQSPCPAPRQNYGRLPHTRAASVLGFLRSVSTWEHFWNSWLRSWSVLLRLPLPAEARGSAPPRGCPATRLPSGHALCRSAGRLALQAGVATGLA